MLAARAQGKPLKLRFCDRSIPAEVEELVASGLEARASKRPTAIEVKEVLERISVRAVPKTKPSERPHRSAVVRELLAGAGLAVALSGVCVGAYASRSVGHGQPSPPSVGKSQASRASPLCGLSSASFVRISNGDDAISNVVLLVAPDADGDGHRFEAIGTLTPKQTAEIALNAFSRLLKKA